MLPALVSDDHSIGAGRTIGCLAWEVATEKTQRSKMLAQHHTAIQNLSQRFSLRVLPWVLQ